MQTQTQEHLSSLFQHSFYQLHIKQLNQLDMSDMLEQLDSQDLLKDTRDLVLMKIGRSVKFVMFYFDMSMLCGLNQVSETDKSNLDHFLITLGLSNRRSLSIKY